MEKQKIDAAIDLLNATMADMCPDLQCVVSYNSDGNFLVYLFFETQVLINYNQMKGATSPNFLNTLQRKISAGLNSCIKLHSEQINELLKG